MGRRRSGGSSETRDDADFDAFFRVEHARILAMGLALTGVREVAVDIAQETMVRVYRNWSDVRGIASPGGWARRVAVNLVNDWHRGNTRFARYAPQMVDHTPVLIADPESARFWAAVRTLPDVQRSAIALYYLEDRSVAEVAEMLEVPEGTVKSSLSRARASLARVLGVSAGEGSASLIGDTGDADEEVCGR